MVPDAPQRPSAEYFSACGILAVFRVASIYKADGLGDQPLGRSVRRPASTGSAIALPVVVKPRRAAGLPRRAAGKHLVPRPARHPCSDS